MSKRGDALGETLTRRTNKIGARVRFTGGKVAGMEATIVGGAGTDSVELLLESGVRWRNVAVRTLQLLSGGVVVPVPSVAVPDPVIMRRTGAYWDF